MVQSNRAELVALKAEEKTIKEGNFPLKIQEHQDQRQQRLHNWVVERQT